MSWLARTIVNSLKLDDEDDDNDKNNHGESSSANSNKPENHRSQSSSSGDETQQPARGVKSDISELTNTLTRQFWGVASFLAPPPSDLSNSDRSQPSDQISTADDDDDVSGGTIRSDFAEIGGKLKTGISKLSSNIPAVSEISKIASNFLQFGSAEEAVGVTEEVVAFAKNIALHPETWLDFPHDQDDDIDDFDMSDAQHEHALAVERLAPELTAIRIEICPAYMSEGCFWKIYFVLLHPRLDKQDALLLSTPQIMNSRANLTHELRNKVKENPGWSGGVAVYSNETATSSHEEHLSVPSVAQFEPPLRTHVAEELTSSEEDSHIDTQNHPNTEINIADKSIIDEEPPKVWDEKYEDDGDDWLKEETTEAGGINETTIPIGNDEEISFSDLEEDDDEAVDIGKKKVTYGSDSSTKESSDWLHVDDIDVM